MTGERAAPAGRAPPRPLVIALVVLAIVAAAAAAFWALTIRMPGRSYAGPLAPLTPAEEESRARLEAHVVELAGRIGERHYLRPAALAALDHMGVEVEDGGSIVRGLHGEEVGEIGPLI